MRLLPTTGGGRRGRFRGVTLPALLFVAILIADNNAVLRREILPGDALDIGGGYGLQAGDVGVDAFRVAETHRRLTERERLTLGGLPRSQHLGQQDVPCFIEFGGRYGFRLEFVEFRERRLFGVRRRFSARRDNGQVEQ